ncbi:kinase [Bacillus sp. 1P06AnD]|uniref:kinase n=1 Tax=Bacillus sp. 1P06AnD TaxID=3132208 RepID=UPI0039A15950
MKGNANLLAEKIKEIAKKERTLIGIDGLSRSGKTTLAEHVKELLESMGLHTMVFHMDDFIVEKKRRYFTGLKEWEEYYLLQWDVKELSDILFQKLHSEKIVYLPFYKAEEDKHEWVNIDIPDRCVIVVEGVFIQREDWRHFFDFSIFLECSREVRFQREGTQIQTNLSKFRNRYWAAEDYYLHHIIPMVQYDLILQGR